MSLLRTKVRSMECSFEVCKTLLLLEMYLKYQFTYFETFLPEIYIQCLHEVFCHIMHTMSLQLLLFFSCPCCVCLLYTFCAIEHSQEPFLQLSLSLLLKGVLPNGGQSCSCTCMSSCFLCEVNIILHPSQYCQVICFR